MAAGLLLAAAGSVAAWLLSAPRPAFGEKGANWLDRGGDPVRGRVVFLAGNCASCHASPGQSDRSRLGGGLALASPFGTLYPPNISPDPVDGIGAWRTLDLANALLSGVSPRGTHYYPGFPYTSFTHMKLGDVRDLMAYLRTLPAVRGRAPPHDLPFPFNIRRLVGFWKLLYFQRGRTAQEAEGRTGWERGQYLVEALGHCAECHSARNLLGALKETSRFAGGQDQEGVGYVPNITPAGIGGWSAHDLVTALTTGRTPDRRILGASMADVVADTAALPSSDRAAIAAYILSLPSRHSPDEVKQR